MLNLYKPNCEIQLDLNEMFLSMVISEYDFIVFFFIFTRLLNKIVLGTTDKERLRSRRSSFLVHSINDVGLMCCKRLKVSQSVCAAAGKSTHIK